LLHPRSAHALLFSPTYLALAGTSSPGTSVLCDERFDAAISTWSLETTLPGDGLNATAAVELGDRIVLIGGFNTTTNVPIAQVLAYDPSTHAWAEGESAPPPLPAPRGGHGAVVLDGKVHVLGGGNSERTLADHSVFDPATRAWSDRGHP
jgi:N-acetylneuraminic acid mutarotase